MTRLGESPEALATEDRKIAAFLERCRYTDLPTDWSAVVGHDHAKRELRVVAAGLVRRDLAERLGLPLVHGILITGPSGSGKTLLARVFAGVVDRPVFVLSAAELTPSRIRRVYLALSDTPCIVVIDELDLIATRKYGRAPRDRTVGALCVALDGVVPVTGPVTIGLTAEDIDSLDPSVIRSGRLTTKIVLEAPDRADRLALWRMYADRVPIQGSLDLDEAADRSQGMTGADIAATALAAAGLALADGLDALDQAHLDEALERRGLVRRAPREDRASRQSVAVHEAGHAVYAFVALGASALNAAVIARSGRGQGHVSLRTEWDESTNVSGHRWREMVRLSLAGLVAEEIVSGPDASAFGSERDLAHATGIVLRAAESGLLKRFGLVSADQMESGAKEESYEPRGSVAMRDALWEAVREEIDRQTVATRIVLEKNRAAIEKLATSLLAAGSLSGDGLIQALRAAGATERRMGQPEPDPTNP
jgi:cell division protease FtsH